MSLLERYKGGMALIAAFITSAIGGFPYTWGTISPYFISYQIQHNPSLTPQDFEWVFASVMLGEIIGYAIVPLMQHRFPVKITFLICALPTLLGFGLAWFTFSAHIATLGFGILLGISGGGLHIVSIWPAWSYFEHYKTRLTGILLSFSSIGAGLTGQLFMNLCNPNNLGNSDLGLFPKEVNDRFQFTLLMMLLVSTILIGIAFVTISVKQTKRSSKMGHGDAPIGPLLKTYGFWNLFLYAVLLFHFLIYMSNSYKVMGLTYIKDDSLLTLASSIGSLISVAGRLTWPIITEFVQFKYFALTQVVLSSAICFLFPFSFSSPTFYFILCISGSLVNSSYYSVLLIHCGNVYGAELGPSVYSYISTTLVITTISVTLIRYLIPVVGYPVICYIIGSIAASAGVFALRASSVKYSGVQKKISEKLL